MARVKTRGTRVTWRTYLCGSVVWMSGFAALFFFAGAVGVYDDPAGARVSYAAIAAALVGVVWLFDRLGSRWGPPA